MYQGPGASPLGRLNQPLLDNRPNVKLEPLSHGIEEDRLVLRNCTKMQSRLDFNTQKIIPDLGHRRKGVHLKIGEIISLWLVFPHTLAVDELLHQALIVCVRK